MLLHQRRLFLAVAIVVMLGGVIGWTWRDWAQLMGREQSEGSFSSPHIAAGAATNRSTNLPIQPGDWKWQREGDTSAAQFAGTLVTVTCDLSARTVSIGRRAEAAEAPAVTILTSTQSRTFRSRKLRSQIVVTLAADDALLDAIAVSRGRFGVEAAGLVGVYPGSWAEVSRVVEDCRVPL
ncbi:hypothetical protein ACLBKT_09265 [Erythrobacter sp. W302b]|uniref:hypothetical protein n=1 Tax=Erythrobacter sp. W302b TaxID=3389874 RepID=UPI00396B3AC6